MKFEISLWPNNQPPILYGYINAKNKEGAWVLLVEELWFENKKNKKLIKDTLDIAYIFRPTKKNPSPLEKWRNRY